MFNREHYRKLFNLTDQQVELFERLQQREALYIRRNGITKVIRLNLDARSYAAFSTKPKDRVRRAKLIAQHGLTEGLTRFAQWEGPVTRRDLRIRDRRPGWAGSDRQQRQHPRPSSEVRSGISSQTSQEAEQILNHFLNRLPTITLKEGSVRGFTSGDILIPSYAEHRVEPTL